MSIFDLFPQDGRQDRPKTAPEGILGRPWGGVLGRSWGLLGLLWAVLIEGLSGRFETVLDCF